MFSHVFSSGDVLFYPSRSVWVSRELISLKASLGRQKLLISSSRRARAPLSTRAKLSLSKKGSKGPRASRMVPPISPSEWEEPCGTTGTIRISHSHDFTHVKRCREDEAGFVLNFCFSLYMCVHASSEGLNTQICLARSDPLMCKYKSNTWVTMADASLGNFSRNCFSKAPTAYGASLSF